jgi:class 3 adenylate cyclase
MDTIGDAYVVVAGLDAVEAGRADAGDLLALALDMRRAVEELNAAARAAVARSGELRAARDMAIRIGVAEGGVVAGVMGERQQRFQVLGPALLRAEELQRQAQPGEIRVEGDVAGRVGRGRFQFAPPVGGLGFESGAAGEEGWRLLSGDGEGKRRRVHAARAVGRCHSQARTRISHSITLFQIVFKWHMLRLAPDGICSFLQVNFLCFWR